MVPPRFGSITRSVGERNRPGVAIVRIGIAMLAFDDYVTDVLMRDLVGHDRRRSLSSSISGWRQRRRARASPCR